TARIFFAWSCPITYWSRMARISCGAGRSDFWPLPPLSDAVSSRMMSLHSSMHSSQMNTDGPAMSLRTSCWLFPQNEQYSSFSPPDFSDIRRSLCHVRTLSHAFRSADQYLVHDPVSHRLIGAEEVVPIRVPLDR